MVFQKCYDSRKTERGQGAFHIKLGLIKQFVKDLNRDGLCFIYLTPRISTAKLTAGVFNGHQRRQLIKDPQFIALMSRIECKAWCSFFQIVQTFLKINEKYAFQL